METINLGPYFNRFPQKVLGEFHERDVSGPGRCSAVTAQGLVSYKLVKLDNNYIVEVYAGGPYAFKRDKDHPIKGIKPAKDDKPVENKPKKFETIIKPHKKSKQSKGYGITTSDHSRTYKLNAKRAKPHK